jgi:hypothetical protein
MLIKVNHMKTNKTSILLAIVLVLSVITFNSCKRNAVEEPDPLGPSTFAIVLNLNASPNVLFAGLLQRQMSAVTATLKKFDGSAVSNRTVFFEVVDNTGTRLDLGYFEGDMAIHTQNTDGSGTVRVNYYGPLSEEIVANGTIYIRATVAWEGAQFISDLTPLYVIRDADEILFEAEAVPDILYAGLTNPTAEIRGKVTVGGQPLKDYPVYFMVDKSQDLGRFSDGKRNTYAYTNADGIAAVTYIGPAFYEILTNTTVTIRVQVTQDIYKDVTIQVIRQR